MSAAGPPQGARPPGGERSASPVGGEGRAAPVGGEHPSALVEDRFVDVDGKRLACRLLRPAAAAAGAVAAGSTATSGARPWLVLLHEGLGSVSMWRDFPLSLALATACPVLAYSRQGYGESSSIGAARPVGYMHHEAQAVLPVLLATLGIDHPVLIGHSDGASIALIHAGSGLAPVRAVVAMAPHVFVEDLSIQSIARAGEAYLQTDLRERLARHHVDVDAAFRGWNDVWLHPDFRHWNIEEYLGRIGCPLLLIQGEDDEYGTMAQLDAVAAQAAGPVEQLRLAECRHSPHRDQPEATVDAISRFVAGLH